MRRIWAGAVALMLLLSSAKAAGAQTGEETIRTLTSSVNSNFADDIVCPNGCVATTVTYEVMVGDTRLEGYVSTGTVFTEAGTKEPIAIPGGYSPDVIEAFSQTVTKTSTDDFRQGGGGEQPAAGTLGFQYADGRYAGFYEWNGRYYPIDVTKKPATRQWKGKGVEAPVLNCPDDSREGPSTNWDEGNHPRIFDHE